jgi:hypothetical protein
MNKLTAANLITTIEGFITLFPEERNYKLSLIYTQASKRTKAILWCTIARVNAP